MTKELTASAAMKIRWLLHQTTSSSLSAPKHFRCAEVLSSPKLNELLDGNIFTVGAKRFRVWKCYSINRFRCAAILLPSFRRQEMGWR